MNSSFTAPTRARVTVYWAATVLAALLFAVPGAGLVMHVAHFTDEMGRLGYPAYFLTFLGVSKILGAIVIIAPRLPRLKEWAYAGMTFDICGALVSHIAVGSSADKLVVPLVIAMILATSWALRPGGRAYPAQGSLAIA